MPDRYTLLLYDLLRMPDTMGPLITNERYTDRDKQPEKASPLTIYIMHKNTWYQSFYYVPCDDVNDKISAP